MTIQPTKKTALVLAEAITKARAAINNPDAIYAKADVDGVEDLIAQSEKVLNGSYVRPFSHSLHFLPDVDPAAFLTRFHTMITGWQTPYDMERTYGMADAADWIAGCDLNAMDAEAFGHRSREVNERAFDVLAAVEPGEGLGNVDVRSYDELKDASGRLDALLAASETSRVARPVLATAVARAADAIRDTLASQKLLFDVKHGANLFLGDAGDATDGDTADGNVADTRAALRERIEADPFLKDQYRQIKSIADQWTPQRTARLADLTIDAVNYTALNDEFRLWASSETTFNFTTPADAATARIRIALPPCDNKADGLGHVWIDNLRVNGPDGDWPLTNPGFEEAGEDGECGIPAGWRSVSAGNATARRETDPRYVFEGKGSLKLCNPDPDSEAGVETIDPIAVPANAGSTVTYRAKIDGHLVKGFTITVTFYDAQGDECGSVSHDFDRVSALAEGPGAALSCQADAIVAYVESDPEVSAVYAEKAKEEILYELDNFCQGAEHWMVENCRPYGSDAYGAVQAGRIMCSVAAAYTLIAPLGAFDGEETTRFKALCDYMLFYVTDARNRTSYSSAEVQLGATNWQTDMFAGTVILSLALLQAGVLDPAESVRARRMVQDGIWFLKSQLNDHVNPDGSFPESLRYHMAALSRYTFVARVVGHCTGADWYCDTTLAPMFRYYAAMVTPAYPFSNTKIPSQPGEAEPLSADRYQAGEGVPSTPTFGDHQIGDGSEFAQLGLCAGDVARVDAKLSRQMLATWARAGRPVAPFWTESVVFEHLLIDARGAGDADPSGAGDWGPLVSNRDYPDSGITLFRKGFATPHEQYLAVMASPRPIGHGHFDEGSFILYKDRVLVVADPGIISYFDASKDWLVSSSAHSVMQFASRYGKLEDAEVRADRLDISNYSRKFGWVDTPRTARVLSTSFGGDVERIDLEVADPEYEDGDGASTAVQTRSILWFPEPELVVVADRVRGFDGRVRFNLPVAARALPSLSPLSDGVAEADFACNYGLSLQVAFLGAPGLGAGSPAAQGLPGLSAEWGLSSPVAPKVDGRDQLAYLRAEGDAANGFTAVLNPMRSGEARVQARWAEDGSLVLDKGNWSATVSI